MRTRCNYKLAVDGGQNSLEETLRKAPKGGEGVRPTGIWKSLLGEGSSISWCSESWTAAAEQWEGSETRRGA